MQNLSLSEMMHTFPLGDFQISGDFHTDVPNYFQHKNMPIYQTILDNERYVFPLFRLSFGKSITVHILTDGVVKKVKHTKIENMPNVIPNLMKQPFLIEARQDKPLYNDVYSIGGFIINNEICLLIKTLNENQPGLFCQHEKASFDGRKINDLNLEYNNNFCFDQSYKEARTRKDTFAFVIIFSLMLEAETTPLLVEVVKDKSSKIAPNIKQNKNETQWITKRIFIDKNIKYKKTFDEQVAYDKTDKKLKDVVVNGYLRRQHYGPENSEEKWIYIESFGSSRWTKEKDKKVIVDIYNN